MRIEDILSRLEGVKPRADGGYQARCPAHKDDNPSLSISIGDNGGTVIYCQAGCDVADVLAAVRLKMSDLFNDSFKAPTSPTPKKAKDRGVIVKTYDYTDAGGNLLYQVVRLNPKGFYQRRPNPERPGEWINNLDGVSRVLYRLPAILAAVQAGDPIYVCEGEKDADAVAALGLCSTTNVSGAGKWKDEYSTVLRGANVVILPDADKPGRDHADKVALSLFGKARSIKVVKW
jgi:putative DNA primase/helicase